MEAVQRSGKPRNPYVARVSFVELRGLEPLTPTLPVRGER
jgi:hypothetical protein